MNTDDSGPGLRCLVTGATGYIGGRLVPVLLAEGHRVRCLARSPGKLRDLPWAGDVEVVRGDVTDAASVADALRDIDVAYYLVHALGTGRDFEETDRAAARVFGEQARAAGVRRIVYLGGLTPAGVPERELSPHLRSRAEVGHVLLESGVPTTVLRAAVVIGSGSASFEMLRHLTERLPVMVTPSWVRTRIQPVAVRDVLRALVGSARMPGEVNRTFDIGGPDILTYRDMMNRYAWIAGLPRRVIVPVPVLTPNLSSLWVGLVTPVPPGIARPLTESLRHEVVCHEHDIERYVPTPPGHPVGFDEAVRLALRRVQDAEVATRWSSASVPGAPSDPLPTDPDWAGGSLYTDRRELTVDAPRDALWRVIEGIGGDNGWYSFPLAWAVRGWLLTGWSAGSVCVGGAGTRRGCGWGTRWTSGGSRTSSPADCCGCGRRCDCRVWRGWRCTPRRTTLPAARAARVTASVPCSIRTACWATSTGGASCPSTGWCSAAWPATSRRRRPGLPLPRPRPRPRPRSTRHERLGRPVHRRSPAARPSAATGGRRRGPPRWSPCSCRPGRTGAGCARRQPAGLPGRLSAGASTPVCASGRPGGPSGTSSRRCAGWPPRRTRTRSTWRPTSAGTRAGARSGCVALDLQGLGITVEPTGGSDVPSSDPVAVLRLPT
ncbi:hypothetical protein SALBM311S_12603 [Streptomyces alboniger]